MPKADEPFPIRACIISWIISMIRTEHPTALLGTRTRELLDASTPWGSRFYTVDVTLDDIEMLLDQMPFLSEYARPLRTISVELAYAAAGHPFTPLNVSDLNPWPRGRA